MPLISPRPLSPELLEELRALWSAEGLPGLRTLRPGLTGAEMDALTEPLEGRLPPELRTLFSWQDGNDDENVRWLGTQWECCALQRAVERTADLRRLGSIMDLTDALPASYIVFAPAWAKSLWMLAVDCAEQAPTSPVYEQRLDDRGAPRLRQGSVGDLFAGWIDDLRTISQPDREELRASLGLDADDDDD